MLNYKKYIEKVIPENLDWDMSEKQNQVSEYINHVNPKYQEEAKELTSLGYGDLNTTVYQLFDDDIPNELHEFAKTIFSKYQISVTMIPPGSVIPEHYDTMYSFQNKTNVNIDDSDIVRLNIFMKDWESGHYFELNRKSYTHWKQGDCISILPSVRHLAGNFGKTKRYTLQITGQRDEFERYVSHKG